jgi:transcriptional regulator with XRE-family HTH domain
MVTKFEILRRGAGLTRSDLAEKAGVSRPTINKIERGDIGNVTVSVLLKCAKAIGCGLMEFFD